MTGLAVIGVNAEVGAFDVLLLVASLSLSLSLRLCLSVFKIRQTNTNLYTFHWRSTVCCLLASLSLCFIYLV